MKISKTLTAIALVSYITVAHAELTNSQTANITAMVNAALSTGNTGTLISQLYALASANPDEAGNIAKVASTAIAAQSNENSVSVLGAVVNAIVTASPANAGDVLVAAQAVLPTEMQTVAVTSVQSALAPAAGGSTVVTASTPSAITTVATVAATAEIPRRSVASPHS